MNLQIAPGAELRAHERGKCSHRFKLTYYSYSPSSPEDVGRMDIQKKLLSSTSFLISCWHENSMADSDSSDHISGNLFYPTIFITTLDLSKFSIAESTQEFYVP